MIRTLILIVLGFVVGAALTYAVVLFGTLFVWDMLGVHDHDGGGAMALGLVIAPVVALIGGVVGAVVASVIGARRRAETETLPADRQRDRRRMTIIVGAVCGAFVGYLVAQFGFWIVGPIAFDSYWKAWAFSWVPTIVMALAALLGAVAARKVAGA